jgi:Flp pilus assembly pilin Flp
LYCFSSPPLLAGRIRGIAALAAASPSTEEVNVNEIKRLILEDDAQTTAEYALVILGAAAVASALIAWAAGGKAVKDFFSKIFSKLTNGL